MIEYVWLIPVFPLVGFLINGLMGERLPKNLVGTIGSLAVGAELCADGSHLPGVPEAPGRRPPGGGDRLHLDGLRVLSRLPWPSWWTPCPSSCSWWSRG